MTWTELPWKIRERFEMENYREVVEAGWTIQAEVRDTPALSRCILEAEGTTLMHRA